MSRLGIDLGTANSAAALFLEGEAISAHNPLVIEPSEGSYHGALIIPSYVAFGSDGTLSAVGKDAKQRYEHGETGHVVRHLKRLIGRPYQDVLDRAERGDRTFAELKDRLRRGEGGKLALEVAGRTLTVEELVAFLLKKIISEAERVADARGDPIASVTVGLPAGFDDMQREATLQAAMKAGLHAVRVIEEPTAAALARSLEGRTGTIMVIDIGAGTTDIVAGSMTRDENGYPRFSCAARTCDEVLGGIDMDYLILEHLLEHDKQAPRLSDVYVDLPPSAKGELMAAIENAKVHAALNAKAGVPGMIAKVLRVGSRAKLINMTLPESLLDQLVAPLLIGRRQGEAIKGVKPLLERTLLEIALVSPERLSRALREPSLKSVTSYRDPRLLRAAGYDPDDVAARVREAIREIDHLILVGGPCRMRSVHRMLGEVFAENPAVQEQLKSVDPEDSFCMEAVARGATMSRGTETSRVPYNISVFTWTGGRRAVIIPRGATYSRAEDLTLSGVLEAHAGGQTLHVLSEKDCPREHWPYRQYELNVPRAGNVRVTLTWREEGLESSRALIEGADAGIQGKLRFPPLKEMATLGDKIKRSLREFAEAAKNLRSALPDARRQAAAEIRAEFTRQFPGRAFPESAIQRYTADWIAQNLEVSESDLTHCEGLDPDALCQPTEEELERMLVEGYFAVRDDLAVRRWRLSARALTAVKHVFNVPRVSAEQLQQVAQFVVSHGQAHLGNTDEFVSQASEALQKVKANPGDGPREATLASASGALTLQLRIKGIAEPVEGLYDTALGIARFYRR